MAEDDPVSQIVCSQFLANLGHDATVVSNGEEAVNAYRQTRFDIVFMDWHMPIMSGLEAVREIRRFDPDGPPVVALTASSLPEEAEQCRAAGMAGVVLKPVNMGALQSEIERLQIKPRV